jgi:DNA polymerase-3 subunit delta
MAHTAQGILDEMNKGIYHPLYFLQGEEPYYINQIREYAEANALAESEKGFNQVVMYGKETSMGQVMNQARRFPMMAQRQLVVVREAQEITDFNKEESQKLLLRYAENPVPSTILLFAHKYKKLDGRKELAKVLDKKSILFTSEKVKDYHLNDWISNYLRSIGLAADPGVSQLLADHIGNDLSRIAGELEKVRSTMQESQSLSRALVLEKVGISKEFNAFELQNALATRNLAKALQITDYFVANPKSAALIPNLAMLFGYFSKLLHIHENQSLRDEELAKQLGIHPYIFKEYRAAAGRYNRQQVLSALHHIRVADGQSKGIDRGEMNEKAVYRELLIRIFQA